MANHDTPDWVRDAVFYQIFPDRFAISEQIPKPGPLAPWSSAPTPSAYHGGDLLGVIERLDHLVDLGVTAIYMTPIFQSASNHRYHTHDYERVDPMLGGDRALRKLLDTCHARGLRVVLDGVFNHASRGFFPFHDILENGPDSPYRDWFLIKSFPLRAYDTEHPPNYAAWWGLPALPKFNIACPAAREYLLKIAVKWVEYGIDGWRLDVANEIDDDDFWREFRHRVREVNPHAYIVGEVWADARHWLEGDMWDAVMNYQFTRACVGFYIGDNVATDELKKTSLHPAGPAGAEAFRSKLEYLEQLYHPDIYAVMLNLIGSHDMARFLTLASGDRSALLLATLFQATYLGAPSIYYGDEIGLSGGHDPANRGAFPWSAPESWDHETLDAFRRYFQLRRERASLRRGSFEFLEATGDVLAFLRQLEDDIVVVVQNVGHATSRVDLRLGERLRVGTILKEYWGGGALRVCEGLASELTLSPRSSRVFATPLPGVLNRL